MSTTNPYAITLDPHAEIRRLRTELDQLRSDFRQDTEHLHNHLVDAVAEKFYWQHALASRSWNAIAYPQLEEAQKKFWRLCAREYVCNLI